jgi:hypothetical protein
MLWAGSTPPGSSSSSAHGEAYWGANSVGERFSGGLQLGPDGGHAALEVGRRLDVYDRDVGREWGSAVDGVQAFDWWPDGRRLAVATSEGVHLVRASDWADTVVLRITTLDLARR